MPQSIIFLTYITYLFRGRDAMDFRISIDRHQQLLWWNSTGGLQTQHQDGIIWLVKPCSKKLLHHFLDGGPGWTRTNDVSKVTGLQPATLAARLLTHISRHITFNGLEPFKFFLEWKIIILFNLLYAPMAGDKGFEPLTCWFRASRSTNWANSQYIGWGWENRTPTNRVKVCWTNRYSNPQNVIPRHLIIALPFVRFSKKQFEKWDSNP